MINKEDLKTWCSKYNLTLINEGNDTFLIPLTDIVKYTKYKYTKNIARKFSRDKLFKRVVCVHGIDNKTQEVEKLCVNLQDAVDIISKYSAGVNETFYKEIVDIYNGVSFFEKEQNVFSGTTSTVNMKKKDLNELCDKFKIQEKNKDSDESVSIKIDSAKHLGSELTVSFTLTISNLK